MAVFIENLVAGIGRAQPEPSPIHPGSQATYVVDPLSASEYPGPMAPYWSQAYIGSDSINMGLKLERGQYSYYMPVSVLGTNPPPIGKYFQSGLVFWPWPLAWTTQVRRNSQSVIAIWDMDRSGNGLSSISCLGCFSGNTASGGQCYAFTAGVDGDDAPQYRIAVNLQRWTFPDVPVINAAEPPNRNLVIETLAPGGYLDDNEPLWGTRLFLYTINRGSTWDISGWVVYRSNLPDPWVFHLIAYVKGINDPGIQAGMGAFAVNTWASTAPIGIMGSAVVGWGPNDVPPELPE